MKIKYLAHSSFLITTEGGTRVLFDPYQAGAYGGGMRYGPVQEEADVVVSSHLHRDHTGGDSIPGSPIVIQALELAKSGPRTIKDVSLRAVQVFHDANGGKERGLNAMTILEADEMRLCHAGDLGHVLTAAQVSEIGNLEILLLPVGGHFTIDAAQATEVMDQLGPRVTIPMHYKTEKIDFPIAPVDGFLVDKMMVRRIPGSELSVRSSHTLPALPEVVVLQPAL